MITLRFNFNHRLAGRAAMVTVSVDGRPIVVTTLKNALTYTGE